MTPGPELHPLLFDPIESERCPKCGNPGVCVQKLPNGLQMWGCPECDELT